MKISLKGFLVGLASLAATFAHAQDTGYYAQETYTSSGGATYSLPFPYLQQSDIEVFDNGVPYTGTITFPNILAISLSPVIPSGDAVVVRRNTPIASAKATFTGGPLASIDLNHNELQALFSLQEMSDDIQRTSGGSAVDATARASAATAQSTANTAQSAASAAQTTATTASTAATSAATSAASALALAQALPAGNITSGTLAGARLPGFTGGDVTSSAGSLNLTLATVNANVGTCGDATHVPVTTFNAKGLATGCTPTAITATGGTPGGSTNQLQYNNASSFGGLSLGGDLTPGTIASGVLPLTVSKVNGVAAGTAANANTGTSGATLGLLNGNNTHSGTDTWTVSPILPTPGYGDNSTRAINSAWVANRQWCRYVDDYGADPTGTNYSDAAITAAMGTFTPSRTNNPCLIFGAGAYKIQNPIAYSFPTGYTNWTIRGQGQENTTLSFPAAVSAGISATYNPSGSSNSVNFSDFTMVAGTAGNGVGISITNQGTAGLNAAPSNISRITFRGTSFYGTSYWTTALLSTGVSQLNSTDVTAIGPIAGNLGTCVNLQPYSSSPYGAIVFNLDRLTCDYLAKGLNVGIQMEGITVDHSNFTGGQYGIYWNNGTSAPGSDELTVTNSEFNTVLGGIYMGDPVSNTMISNNLFIVGAQGVSGGFGILFAKAALSTVTNNTFNNAANPNTAAAITYSGTVGGSNTVADNIIDGTFTTGVAVASPVILYYGNNPCDSTTTCLSNGSANTVQTATQTYVNAAVAAAVPGAWTTYPPAVTTTVGTIGTVSNSTGSYSCQGKTCQVHIYYNLTTAGSSPSGYVQVTLPFTAAAQNVGSNFQTMSGFDINSSNNGLIGFIPYSSNLLQLIYAAGGGSPYENGAAVSVSGTYQIQ